MSGGGLLLAAGVLLAVAACLRRHTTAWVSLTLAGCACTAGSAISVFAGGAWDWQGNFKLGGELAHLRMDALSAFFAMLLSVLGAAGALYSVQYWSVKQHPCSAPTGRILWNTVLIAMGVVLCCINGLHFLIAWEIFTVTAYFLITVERRRVEVRRAGWLYLAASHAGTLCLFGFFTFLAARTGSWSIGPMHEHPELAPVFWLALAGFGIKAGLFPLHIWLPSAHANAPTHVSAILSGVAIKMGIYGIVRFSGWLPLPAGAGWVVLALGAASSVLGVAFALAQHDLKRLLAYHSVENIGIILLGLGLAILGRQVSGSEWGALAIAGGLLHVWNHGVFKALLFLGAGSVLHATGTRHMSSLGGLWRAMPWTASLFALGAAAISGLPPLNGFVSEWLVYLGLFDAAESRGPAAWVAVPAAISLAITGALALACFVKVVGIVFLGLPRSKQAEHAHECGPSMRNAMLFLAAICVFIGLFPVAISPVLQQAVTAWNPAWTAGGIGRLLTNVGAANLAFLGVAILASWVLVHRVKRNGLRRGLTWDCGYAAPAPRMQYTAGSFASTITGWFGWILRPETHRMNPEGLFPQKALAKEHTPETVLEKVIFPVSGAVMRLSTEVRRYQHGRLQAYILYLVFGLAGLAIIAWLGARL
jgi:hydrogenase-4 component B